MKLSRFTPRFYIALALVLIVAFVGLLGPLVFSGKDLATSTGGSFDPPSGHAWLGTDNLGHDEFTYLLYGTRASLIVGLLAGTIGTLIGVIIGTIAGYLGGYVEETLMAFTNVILAIPQIVILVLISVALSSQSVTSVGIVIAVTSWPWTARAVRAQASSLRTREHLDIGRHGARKRRRDHRLAGTQRGDQARRRGIVRDRGDGGIRRAPGRQRDSDRGRALPAGTWPKPRHITRPDAALGVGPRSGP